MEWELLVGVSEVSLEIDLSQNSLKIKDTLCIRNVQIYTTLIESDIEHQHVTGTLIHLWVSRSPTLVNIDILEVIWVLILPSAIKAYTYKNQKRFKEPTEDKYTGD